MQYFFKASRWPSASALCTFSPPRTVVTATSNALRFKPLSRANLPHSALLSHRANKNNSLAMYWSPRLIDSFSAAWMSEIKSRPTCTCSCPSTLGKRCIAVSAAVCKPCTLAPARSNNDLGPSSWRNIATNKWDGSIYAWSLPMAKVCASDRASWNLVVSLSRRMKAPDQKNELPTN